MNIDKIPYYLQKGMFHKFWYEEESEKLVSLLPEFAGLPILRTFAVTSMTTSIEANVHLAVKALLQMKRCEEFTGFLPTQIIYLNLIRKGNEVPGRKIGNFIRALEGDTQAVVVDIWMTHAFGLSRKRAFGKGRTYYYSPTKKEYDLIEAYCQSDAKIRFVDPRQYQSMVWTGIKQEMGMTKNVSWSDLLVKKKGMFLFI